MVGTLASQCASAVLLSRARTSTDPPAGRSGVATWQPAQCTARRQRLVVVGAKGKGFGNVPDEQKKPAPRPLPPPVQMASPAPAPPPEPEKASLPQVVSDRIIGRMVLFSGVPLVLGFASGPIVYYLKVVQKAELEPGVLYLVGTTLFALAAFGISYGALSASWDPNRESDGLGIEDFKRNLPIAASQLPFAKKR